MNVLGNGPFFFLISPCFYYVIVYNERSLTNSTRSSRIDCIVPCYLFLCLANCTESFGKGAGQSHNCLNVLLNRSPFTLLTKSFLACKNPSTFNRVEVSLGYGAMSLDNQSVETT